MTPYGNGIPLVVDTSAWVRQTDPAYRQRWRDTAAVRLLVACPVAALELLTSARDQLEFDLLDEAFTRSPQAPLTASACRAAVGATRDLGGRRRPPAADILIAAAAAEGGFGVLHVDAHFDLLATVLPFASVRLDSA